MNEFLPVTLKADNEVGLFIYSDNALSLELGDSLTDDLIEFSFNPPEAAHLALPGYDVFVFGHFHPRVLIGQLEDCGEEVVIDPSVVITEDLYEPPVKQLLSLGNVKREGRLDYVALGISRNDVPALICMAADVQLHEGPPDSPVVYAPVHALRALVQLRAGEAVAPLVEVFRRVDEGMDDWVSEDLPKGLAEFGAAALEPLTVFLANAERGDWSRVAAAQAIQHVGEAHPELRLDCVARLSAQLERFADQSETLNAFLISPLWELRAVEAMPVIERAFASGRVDESVMGDVEDVQMEFGLKTRREHPPKPNKLTRMGDELRAGWTAAGLPLPGADESWPEADPAPSMLSEPYIAPPKIGRNDPCSCGSGKKFKKCCGA